VPIPQRLVGQGLSDGRNAGAVAEQIADGGAPSTGEELRPPAVGGGIQLDAPLLDQLQQHEGDDRLPHRVGVDEGVIRPLPPEAGIGPAAPEVDDHPPADGDGEGGTHLASVEVGGEGLADRAERGIAGPPDHEPTVGVPATMPPVPRTGHATSTLGSDVDDDGRPHR
jgi:hypothetical protein